MSEDTGTTEPQELSDLFLCHNKADKDWTRRLAEHVESETIDGTPNARRLRVFFDEWDIDYGENVVLRLGAALEDARYVGVVLSPEMLAMPWPAFEWTDAVVSDPINAKKRLIPLFLRDGSEGESNPVALPAPFKVLRWIDFRGQSRFKRSYQQLIRKLRGLPPARGRRRRPLAAVPRPAAPVVADDLENAATPDRVAEAILGNLLPVQEVPRTIWSASTSVREAREVFAAAPEAPAFALKGQRIYTFADLSEAESGFASVINRRHVRAEQAADWRINGDKWRWYMELLNRCLRGHLGGLPIRRDQRGRFFFLPDGGETRTWQNGTDPKREVAAKKTSHKTGDEFWVHQAAWLQFESLGNALYLLVEPAYVFTSDGITPLESSAVGPLSMAWSGRERNAAILRHVVFWARTLSKGKARATMRTGGPPLIVSGIPAIARTNMGIEFDHVGVGSLLSQVENELGRAADSVVWLSDSEEDHDDESPTAEID